MHLTQGSGRSRQSPDGSASDNLQDLVRHLARGDPFTVFGARTAYCHDSEAVAGGRWEGWQIERVPGGWCNLLYRARNAVCDLAIKFTMDDARDRAGREWGALTALRAAGRADIAPEPVLLDRACGGRPVVVQTWLEGEVEAAPPTDDSGWERILEHMVRVHSVNPANANTRLPRAVVNASTVEQARRIVHETADHIPVAEQPASLVALLERFDAASFPRWLPIPSALCRADWNMLNLVRRPGLWASVDWENAGWGDPACDVAECLTHPENLGVPPGRWRWLVKAYCGRVWDASAAMRIAAYQRILCVRWTARMARYLYEIPRGADQRLAPWPDDWQSTMTEKYEQYLGLSEAALA